MICLCASRRGRADSIEHLTSYRTDIASALHRNLVVLFLTLNTQRHSDNFQDTRLPELSFLYYIPVSIIFHLIKVLQVLVFFSFFWTSLVQR